MVCSNCERPTILLVATKVDSLEQILSKDEEKIILKNSMDLLTNKNRSFLLFDEIFQTSASPSAHTGENNKIRSFGSIRKLLCRLSELSTSHNGFFVPHTWEKFGKILVVTLVSSNIRIFYHISYWQCRILERKKASDYINWLNSNCRGISRDFERIISTM